jgi:hypothetical protein
MDASLTTIPLFKGDDSKYSNWFCVFVLACARQKCAKALLPTHAAALPADPESATLTDAQTLAVKQNDDAIHLLNTSLQGDTMGLFVILTYTTAYPNNNNN